MLLSSIGELAAAFDPGGHQTKTSDTGERQDHRRRKGLMKPARLPIESMKAIPAAAAVPARNAVGRVQKSGNVVRMPRPAI
ncbi:MAG: hypothetical protein WA624_18745 [Methylocella sp.]